MQDALCYTHHAQSVSAEASFPLLETQEALEAAVARSQEEPVVLFKHSRICPTSTRARMQMLQLDAPGDPPVYEVVVQDARPVSNEIAARFDIKHESPQVILLRQGRPVYHASHGRVRAASVRETLAG